MESQFNNFNRQSRIGSLIAALGLVVLMVSFVVLFIINFFKIKEIEKNTATLKLLHDSTRSLRKMADSLHMAIKAAELENGGISPNELKNYSSYDFSKSDSINHYIKSLIGKIDTSTTIRYYPKLADQDRALLSLKDIGFKLVLFSPTEYMAHTPTNSIWFGPKVKIENVEIVALFLLRAGINIKAIRPFAISSEIKDNLIEVGADIDVVNLPAYNLQRIKAENQFKR